MKDASNKQCQNRDESWKKTPTAAGEPNTKTVNGWHWYVHHMSWCGHTSRECRLEEYQIAASMNAHKTNHVANSAT